MNKKSQGLSINVIIIVAIALIVLVVLIAIFTGRLGAFTTGLQGATTCNDLCTASGFASGEIKTETGVQTSGIKDSNNNLCTCSTS